MTALSSRSTVHEGGGAAAPAATLTAVMYHYVRDLPRTRFPRIKGLLTDAFRRQVAQLCDGYEMATLESALAFLSGEYQPRRPLCLLTFDDGFRDHLTDVLPILAERRVRGLFFVTTGCLEEGRVLPVHKNHFLMAALPFDDYRREFLARAAALAPEIGHEVDDALARRNYPRDTPDVAALKYLLNFRLPEELRGRILNDLFAARLGDERAFARELYLSWDEARALQDAGMVIGGHSHRHVALATLDEPAQRHDLTTCAHLLHARLKPQPLWPFSYPYGKPGDSFGDETVRLVAELGFCCAFTTAVGDNAPGQERFSLRRTDTNDVTATI